MPSLLNPFTDPAVVTGYEDWYRTTGRAADRREKAILAHLLSLFPDARSILEVGCGTGHFTRWFEQQGLQVVGLDLSAGMLRQAVERGGPHCLKGDALALPFTAGAFDLVALITTLEFLPDPSRALAEAVRTSRLGVLLGVLNRHSLLGSKRKTTQDGIWEVARFYTIPELKLLARRSTAGREAKIVWRTTLWPLWPGSLPLPWGGFIGMAVRLVH